MTDQSGLDPPDDDDFGDPLLNEQRYGLIEDLSRLDDHMLRHLLAVAARTGGLNNVDRGLYAEVRIAYLTGGELVGTGDAWGPVDVRTNDGFAVQVKASGRFTAWTPQGTAKVSWTIDLHLDDVDAVVFARHDSMKIASEWSYAVVPAATVRHIGQKTWSPATVLRHQVNFVTDEDVSTAITAACAGGHC